jgi:hypothetical protein
MSTTRLFGRRLPFSGGGYFRLFPYPVVRRAGKSLNAAGAPMITYLHPWEFDPGQPRLKARAGDRFKHYLNLGKTEGRFRRMLADFRFGTVRQVLTGKLGEI